MGKTKDRKVKPLNQNDIEAPLNLGGFISDTLKQVGIEKYKNQEQQQNQAGDLAEGQELNLKELAKENSKAKEEIARIEPAIDYAREIVHAGERLATRENKELEEQLRELMTEIKKLADSSKELQMQFKEVAVEQNTVKPGKYHKSFFSWLLIVIRTARMKVEDSGAWLSAMQSKKKSREYGSMAKKHGTTFTLNNERTVATQVG